MARAPTAADEKTVDWRLVFSLSLFGLVMAVATVFLIPSPVEPVFWLVVFVVCAYVIAKRAPSRFFLHGFLVSVVNSAWVTSAHMLFVQSYLARHPREAETLTKMPLPDSPRLMMLMTGPLVGIVTGVILGLFCFVAKKLVKRAG